MKKFRWLLLIAGSFLISNLIGRDVLLEAQGAYYYPTSHRFREIYSGSGIYGLELSVQTGRHIYLWTSGSAFLKSGHSIGLHSSTRLAFVPIGIGVKYLCKIKSADLYLGAGVLPTYAHIHNHFHGVGQKSSKWACGGIAKVGVIFNLPKSFFLDIFTNYSYVKFSNHNSFHGNVYPYSYNLSGFSFGGGIGYRFGSRR